MSSDEGESKDTFKCNTSLFLIYVSTSAPYIAVKIASKVT